jgi:hypothetical protein
LDQDGVRCRGACVGVAGYSGTPLGKKLGFKPGMRVVLVDAPEDYAGLVAPVPDGVTFSTRLTEVADMFHVFSTEKKRLARTLGLAVQKLVPNGMIWVSWPKKSSRVPTDITEDTIREVAFPLGLVDIKVCAIDAVWSGLKLVIRKALR